ncbi:hypothetical protein GLOIN_2v1798535 [Rhizophagus clarus]|uniref:Uncharacterized protein n=1 Tax=Rhizophagus clarus TaxID=94130 RepID=A0A8H3KYY0_9GLOM|nr:hypothetical protein GLOIN_2v1798535 [Rhizophagus clarus]
MIVKKKESDGDNEDDSEKESDGDNEDIIHDLNEEDDKNHDSKNDVYNKDIEFENFDNSQPKPSALMILELCRDALKSSHIYWPVDFSKNIADLHLLRIFLGYNSISKTQSPQRDEQIELMLKTRIKETEIIQGIPGSHINLNMTNEEFLDYNDNLFVQRHIPHDDIHELIKYGDRPIYESLKKDKSKAWIEKSLFEKIDYQTKLNCVREEAMAIALERYLIPMISKDQETSYNLALNRICTTLTKGWFRQFAVDNYPQLINLDIDKDLVSIANDIINKNPLKQKKKRELIDPETLAIFETIRPYTEIDKSLDDVIIELGSEENDSIRRGIKIKSPENNEVSISAVITTIFHCDNTICNPCAELSASIVIFPSDKLDDMRYKDDDETSESDYTDSRYIGFEYYDPLNLHPQGIHNYVNYKKGYRTPGFSEVLGSTRHVFALKYELEVSTGGSWSVGSDYWKPIKISAKSADYYAQKLGIPGFNGDLLFKYVLYYLNPTFPENGDKPLKHVLRKLLKKEPQEHLWYHFWDYALKTGQTTFR